MLELNRHQFSPSRPPVLVQSDLDLVRTLGIADIPVIVGSSESDDPAFVSRYCRGRCMLPSRYRPDEFAAELISVGDQLIDMFGRPVPLMCAADDWLEIIYTHREQLQTKFLLLLNDPEMAVGLLFKDQFEPLARRLGLPVPRDLVWEELPGIDGTVIAKPRSRASFTGSLVQDKLFEGENKALIFDSGAVAAAQPLVERFQNNLTFQEYVRGDDSQLWSFHGFSDERGSVLASFVGRKIRTSPPHTGQSAFIELIHSDEFSTYGHEMSEQMRLKGPFKLDFKTDEATGRHYLLEVNARFNLWNHLGAVNGVNLTQVAYDYLVSGTRPPALPYRTKTRWISLPRDFRSYRDLARQGELGFFAWIASILRTPTIHRHFSWSDPVPFISLCTSRAFQTARRFLGRVTALLRRWLSTAS